MVTQHRVARSLRGAALGATVGLPLLAMLLGPAPALAGPPRETEQLLARWNEIGRKLIAIADDLPEDRYGYRPPPDARSFVDQLLHPAGAMASFAARVLGRPERYPCDPTGAELKTKADVQAFVRRGGSEGADLLRAAGEEGLSRAVSDGGGGAGLRLADLPDQLIEHSGEHYGQLVLYYRADAMVPPE